MESEPTENVATMLGTATQRPPDRRNETGPECFATPEDERRVIFDVYPLDGAVAPISRVDRMCLERRPEAIRYPGNERPISFNNIS